MILFAEIKKFKIALKLDFEIRNQVFYEYM